MKTCNTFSGLFLLLGTTFLSSLPVFANLEISGQISIRATADFHAPLATHGAWIEVGSYGRCWRPASVAVDWRPYCYGHWVWTDCGWYWSSDEPWAWACYHYGSWAYEDGFGWVWVPGIEWAPAWVSWRFGGGYCGWAPLGPRGVVVAPGLFVFVETHRFREPIQPRTVIVNNTTIINRTTVINNVRSETRALDGAPRKVMVNEGPGAAAIEQATKTKVTRVAISEAVRQTPRPPASALSTGGQPGLKDRKADASGNDPKTDAPGKDPKAVAPTERSAPEKKSAPSPTEPPGRGRKPDVAPGAAPRPEPGTPPGPGVPGKPAPGKDTPGKEIKPPPGHAKPPPAQHPGKPPHPPPGDGKGKKPDAPPEPKA